MEFSRREFVTLLSSAAAALASQSIHAQSLRVRRELRTLSSTDIDVLKSGVSAMKALPKTDFRSWLYQSGVHGALAGEDAGVADAATYWNQCVHSGPHFLSWHRWELLFIEEIIRLMSDQCTFTLPYWDYIANGFLPTPLWSPADATNPLFNDTRASALNNGTGALSGLNADALTKTPFNLFSSLLYGNPHSAVHGQIGGDMGDVPTAARDPVFYFHHCNIDRYWECWLRMGGGRTNPPSPWPEQTFPFRTTTGRRDAIVGDCARTADLGYTYDNLPCSSVISSHLEEILRNLRFIAERSVPPRPIPDPWPWTAMATFSSFALDGRPTALVLPRGELRQLAERRSDRLRTAVTLQDVEMQRSARENTFFFELWFVPDLKVLRSGKLEGAEQIGSFSAFDLSNHASRGHMPSHALAFELSQNSERALASGTEDVAVLFVRRGLVDKEGRPLPFDEKAELLKVGALRIDIGK